MTKMKHILLQEFPSKFESNRLRIRKYENGDGEAFFNLFERNDNRNFLKDHVDEATDILSLTDAEIRVRTLSSWWISRTRIVLGIWLKESEEYIGNIWIEPKYWDVPSFEIGYYLDKGYIGKGYATEAVIRSLKFLFEDLNTHKVILITRDNNERSYKLAERVGFIKEGHFKESNIENGKRFGLLYYRMLRTEYSNLFKKEE
ncbi:MAG: GNAT family N-acetyltransferase [Asgard group archaeon]|nr:GNAT family N-acetyltransferase [Asgard group archaeon]